MTSALLQLATAAGDANLVLFDCPRCGASRSLPVGERATRLLGRAGITLVAAAADPGAPGSAPALGVDSGPTDH